PWRSCQPTPNMAASCNSNRPSGSGCARRHSTRLAASDATHRAAVVQCNRAVQERQRWGIFKRGSIDWEATESSLLEALHVPEALASCFQSVIECASNRAIPVTCALVVRMVSLQVDLVATG